jgi:hypothetical protein
MRAVAAIVAASAVAGLGEGAALRDTQRALLSVRAHDGGAEGAEGNNAVCQTIMNTWWPLRVAQQSNVTQLDQWCSTYNGDATACNNISERSAYSSQPSNILNAACTMQGHKNLNW